jgi:hypothetical protein
MAILLWGVPSGDDFSWDLTYKFHTEECITESTGYATGFPKYSYPTRELKFSLGVTDDQTFDRLSAFLNAGVTTVTVPLWFFRTTLSAGLTIGESMEALVGDSSEFYSGDQALLMQAFDPSVCELMNITSVAGSTLYFDAPVTNDYHVYDWSYGWTSNILIGNAGFENGETWNWIWISHDAGSIITYDNAYEGYYKLSFYGQDQIKFAQPINLSKNILYRAGVAVKGLDDLLSEGTLTIGNELTNAVTLNFTTTTDWQMLWIEFILEEDLNDCYIQFTMGPSNVETEVDNFVLQSKTARFRFDTSTTYVFPVISGYVEYEGLDFISGKPALGMKAKIEGGAWNSFTVPSMPTNFVFQAMDAKYTNPKILRDLCGVENGIFSMYPHGDSSKLTFECTWNFCDSNWRTLRDIFFAARGKAQSFFMSTNMYELTTTRGADEGSTTIYLNPGYQYLYERFPYLMIYSRRTTNRFLVHVTAHVWRDEFTCDALNHELYDGSRACIYLPVFFESDELTFSFKGINMCHVKATFIEDPS